MTTELFQSAFDKSPAMAIIRGLGADRTVQLAQSAWSRGIHAVEVPLQSDEDLDSLKATVRMGDALGVPVGAGTVTNPSTADIARNAGASFLVSPGLDLALVEYADRMGMPTLAGVATATEIQRGMEAGLVWLKAFPASVLGVSWFEAMSSPFPNARFVATGGVTPRDAAQYLAAGAHAVAIGRGLENPSDLEALERLRSAPAR